LPEKIHKALLPYWKEFCDHKRANADFANSDKLSKFNRFRARHRLATKLTGLRAEGLSEQALRGYTAGLRLMLAYSAAEIPGSALDIVLLIENYTFGYFFKHNFMIYNDKFQFSLSHV
jgi:hypothetical protein